MRRIFYIALEIAQLPVTFGGPWRLVILLSYDFQDWTKLGLSCLNPPLLLASIWWLWKAKNSICIANEELPLIQIKYNVRSLASFLSIAFQSSNNTPASRWVTWRPSKE